MKSYQNSNGKNNFGKQNEIDFYQIDTKKHPRGVLVF
jgi:hypothetical protein